MHSSQKADRPRRLLPRRNQIQLQVQRRGCQPPTQRSQTACVPSGNACGARSPRTLGQARLPQGTLFASAIRAALYLVLAFVYRLKKTLPAGFLSGPRQILTASVERNVVKTYKPAVTSSRLVLQFLLTAVAVALAACAGPGSVVTPISVQVTPATASVQTGQTQQFTATVSGTTNTAVTWQVSSSSASAASIGTINSSGLYTAPSTVPTGGTVTVIATSQADSTKSGTAVVTVTAPPAVVVTVSPKTATVTTGLTQQFSASVTNTSNTAVTWQVNNVTGGNSTTGTISGTGLFTAPTTVPASNPVTVKATSVADNTKSDTASVTITPAPSVSVTIAPKRGGLTPGQTMTFTPTV